MIARKVLGVVLALCVAFAFTAAGEKTQKKASKDATGCCAEMTKVSSTDGKSCDDKAMKGSSAQCETGTKGSKAKAGGANGCCDHASMTKVSGEKSGETPSTPLKDKK